MNGPSISRKPVGRKPVGQITTSIVPQQSSFSSASPVAFAPTTAAYTPVLQTAPAPSGQQLQSQYPPATRPISLSTAAGTPSLVSYQGQSPYQPAPTPTPGQLQRTVTASSVQSQSSQYSGWTSSVGPNTPLSPATTPGGLQQDPWAADAGTKFCALCKQAIAQNVSIFTCLVCSTAHVSTNVCVWCFTTGAAAASHEHDISYLATESDIRIQAPNGNIPVHLWTVRKNASGRLWYVHNQTGYRTHVQPATGGEASATTELPPGWQEMKTPDGKLYYFHPGTNASSWTKPRNANALPRGWKLIKTPDGVPFYVHDALQLATWDRPGEQPRPKLNKAAATGVATAAAAATAAGTVVKAKKKEKGAKGSSTASKTATAISVASNVAKLSAAADLSPSGIFTATVAAAKLTGLGVKVASKKMGKFGKMKHLSTATNLIGAASKLAGDEDGEDEDFEEAEEIEEYEETGETGAAVDEGGYANEPTGPTDTYAEQPPQDPYMATQEQPATEQQPYYYQEQAPPQEACMPPQEQPAVEQPYYYQEQPPQQETCMPPQDQPVAEQQPYYYPEQPAYPNDQPPQQDVLPQQDVPPQPYPVIVNNVNVTVEETYVNEVNYQTTDYTETNLYAQTEYTEINQNTQQEPVTTETAWTEPYQPVDNIQPGYVLTEPQLIEAQPTQAEQPIPAVQAPEMIPPADVTQPTTYTDTSAVAEPAPPASGEVPPFVFNPILAGPMMVNPPAEQGGVVFAPTYV